MDLKSRYMERIKTKSKSDAFQNFFNHKFASAGGAAGGTAQEGTLTHTKKKNDNDQQGQGGGKKRKRSEDAANGGGERKPVAKSRELAEDRSEQDARAAKKKKCSMTNSRRSNDNTSSIDIHAPGKKHNQDLAGEEADKIRDKSSDKARNRGGEDDKEQHGMKVHAKKFKSSEGRDSYGAMKNSEKQVKTGGDKRDIQAYGKKHESCHDDGGVRKESKKSQKAESDKKTHRNKHEGKEGGKSEQSHPSKEGDKSLKQNDKQKQAYRDIVPLLVRLTGALGLTKETVKIYDPYYCAGGVIKRLGVHGFTNVYNKCEDFYQAIDQGKVPEFDILLTNPPYSADHFEKIIRFAVSTGKPWLLLVPNFIYTKDFFKAQVLDDKRQAGCLYMVPKKRYTYWTPEWLHTTKFGVSTSPFPSFWFVQCLQHTRVITDWFRTRGNHNQLTLASNVKELPNEVRAAFDPMKKRPSNKARKRMAAQKADARASASLH